MNELFSYNKMMYDDGSVGFTVTCAGLDLARVILYNSNNTGEVEAAVIEAIKEGNTNPIYDDDAVLFDIYLNTLYLDTSFITNKWKWEFIQRAQ